MGYSTNRMVLATGATQRQLLSWEKKGWITGVDNRRRSKTWTEDDFRLVHLMMRLIRAGFETNAAYRYASTIRNRPEPRKRGVRIHIESDMWVIVKGLGDATDQANR